MSGEVVAVDIAGDVARHRHGGRCRLEFPPQCPDHRTENGERQLRKGELDRVVTARPDVSWIDLDDSKETVLRKVRECSHTQLLVSRGSIDEFVGVVEKQDPFRRRGQ